jgi:hypothetical protein
MTWRAVFFSFRGRIDREAFSFGERILLGVTVLAGNLVIAPILDILWLGPPPGRWYSQTQHTPAFFSA